jgi:lipopolysaccharide transport system permease protein
MNRLLLPVWRYRYFIVSSIKVDFRARFARSRLGGLWMVIHPLVQAAMFALILSQLMSSRLPDMSDNKLAYAIYLLSGTLAWNLFTEVVTRCLTVFIDNGNLLKKLVFPRICLPIIVSGSAVINNLLLFGAILLILVIMGFVPGINVVWVPMLIAITLALSLGLGLILGTLNVFMRDIGQIVPILLQLGFWFTPIVYPANIVPATIRQWQQLNPMYWLVQGYQNAILFNAPPTWLPLAWIILLSLVLLRTALLMFRRASSEMVDVL